MRKGRDIEGSDVVVAESEVGRGKGTWRTWPCGFLVRWSLVVYAMMWPPCPTHFVFVLSDHVSPVFFSIL